MAILIIGEVTTVLLAAVAVSGGTGNIKANGYTGSTGANGKVMKNLGYTEVDCIIVTTIPSTLLTGTIANERLPVTGVKLGFVKSGGNITINADGSLSHRSLLKEWTGK